MENPLDKKDLAIVLGSTGNMAFAVANVLIGIKKYTPNLQTDFIIFENDFEPKDKELLNTIFPCKFLPFEFPIVVHEKQIKRYSTLAFSKYECFNLLNDYKKVIWLDIDILIQGNIQELIDFCDSGAGLYLEEYELKYNFSQSVPGFNMENFAYNTGIMVLNDDIKEYNFLTKWCYEKTVELRDQLTYADQGVINLLLENFHIKVKSLPEKYNCRPDKRSVKEAVIVHSYSSQKFWKYYDLTYRFKEWDENYHQWLEMGGSAYTGQKYTLLEKLIMSKIHPLCPCPVRQTRKFFKFLINREKYLNSLNQE